MNFLRFIYLIIYFEYTDYYLYFFKRNFFICYHLFHYDFMNQVEFI